jgi:hypothetical protein
MRVPSRRSDCATSSDLFEQLDLPPEVSAALDALGEDGRDEPLSVMVTLTDEARAKRIVDR